jgi:hypothetical protein
VISWSADHESYARPAHLVQKRFRIGAEVGSTQPFAQTSNVGILEDQGSSHWQDAIAFLQVWKSKFIEHIRGRGV